MLKKITATGVLAAAATGVMLSGGSASADRISAVPAGCYYNYTYYAQPYCDGYYGQQPVAIAPPVSVAPITVYPGAGYGWGRWHGWGGYPHHWHH